MTGHNYLIQLGVTDSMSGSTVIDVTVRHITISHIYLMIEALQSMIQRFKTTTVPYITILNDTVNTMNASMSELEGNNAYCTLSLNYQQHDAATVADQIIGSMDEDTMDATIDMDVPVNALDSNSLVPFLYTVNRRHIFSYGIQSVSLPDWNDVLRDLNLLTI